MCVQKMVDPDICMDRLMIERQIDESVDRLLDDGQMIGKQKRDKQNVDTQVDVWVHRDR